MAIEVIEANGSLDAALCKVARTIFSVLKARDKNEPLVIGVCGGRSIVGLLTSLKNEAAYQPKNLMERVHFFMVDERLVPLANEQSNFGGLQRLLFDELVLDGSLKSEQLHPLCLTMLWRILAARVTERSSQDLAELSLLLCLGLARMGI